MNGGLKDELLLLKEMSEGDSGSFSLLYNYYSRQVYRFIYKYLKSSELTDDLVQEIFIKVWDNRINLSDLRSFKSYLFTISKNHTLNFLKRAAIDKNAKSLILSNYRASVSIEEDLQTKDYLNYLEKILDTLTPQSRETFRLCRQEYKSYDEAAEILGISRNTVKKHMVKSMKIVGKAVQKDLGIPLTIFLGLLIK
ncbi:RNA polymerase sigma-70 factor [Pedobacter sp. HDW13]|uniref:RNA polymerase sigma factor n=1 Tax=unclassified Pedobacter TaxID=2628915 RepID=UPI000F5B8135|nr:MULTISPECIES: RNA polymerase sigma-70 factor [unclassified Pedobacter]QIL41622.1 RNA polymerase sigma-70 factor [Pedobacter sp. HDW13]RQO64774.1 RNA polymerase subunit sigma-70 [Pedobacter sp. KBW01]